MSGKREDDDRSPTVSIGVPVYNGENFLGDAIETHTGCPAAEAMADARVD